MNEWNTADGREYLKTMISNGIWRVRFTKRDGTERTLICTRNMKFIPADSYPKGSNIVENVDVLRVWSTEDKGWRSFRYDSVLGALPAFVMQEESD